MPLVRGIVPKITIRRCGRLLCWRNCGLGMGRRQTVCGRGRQKNFPGSQEVPLCGGKDPWAGGAVLVWRVDGGGTFREAENTVVGRPPDLCFTKGEN